MEPVLHPRASIRDPSNVLDRGHVVLRMDGVGVHDGMLVLEAGDDCRGVGFKRWVQGHQGGAVFLFGDVLQGVHAICGLVNVLADLTIGRMDGLHVNETWSPAFVLFFPGAGFLEEYVR